MRQYGLAAFATNRYLVEGNPEQARERVHGTALYIATIFKIYSFDVLSGDIISKSCANTRHHSCIAETTRQVEEFAQSQWPFRKLSTCLARKETRTRLVGFPVAKAWLGTISRLLFFGVEPQEQSR
jgi:hypothetical protein